MCSACVAVLQVRLTVYKVNVNDRVWRRSLLVCTTSLAMQPTSTPYACRYSVPSTVLPVTSNGTQACPSSLAWRAWQPPWLYFCRHCEQHVPWRLATSTAACLGWSPRQMSMTREGGLPTLLPTRQMSPYSYQIQLCTMMMARFSPTGDPCSTGVTSSSASLLCTAMRCCTCTLHNKRANGSFTRYFRSAAHSCLLQIRCMCVVHHPCEWASAQQAGGGDSPRPPSRHACVGPFEHRTCPWLAPHHREPPLRTCLMHGPLRT